MNHEMFCFQCEQTAGCTGCVGKAGVCGKTAGTAKLQDELTGALIGLARAADQNPDYTPSMDSLILESLFAAVTNVSFDDDRLRGLISRVHDEKNRLVPDCQFCAMPITTWNSSGMPRKTSVP